MKLPFAALAVLVIATPALAQPIDITVRGGNRFVETGPTFGNSYRLVYGDPWNFDFDPAAAAVNAEFNARFRPRNVGTFNLHRAYTLNVTGESLVAHQLRCQARHATYELVSDTYLGSNGIPRPCGP